MAEAPSIDARDVGYRYGKRVALSNFALRFGRGVLGLLGPNGAGKTTLLELMATASLPSQGSIRLLGYDPRVRRERQAIRRRLGYLPQSMGHFPDFTAAEFVEYFALLKGVPRRGADRAVADALGRVGLQEAAGTKLRHLSGGQLRRVGIAQAIANHPHLLLFDEPTVGLDPAQRVTFRTLIRDLGASATVVVSTHLVEDVAAACSEVAVLSEGRLVFVGTPEALACRGGEAQEGDSAIERGYNAVLNASGWGT